MNTSNIHLAIIRNIPSIGGSLFLSDPYDVILCYHGVEGRSDYHGVEGSNDYHGVEDTSNDNFNVTPSLFKQHIKALNDAYELTDFDEIVKTENTGKSVRVAISFDDGYKSVFTHAYPVLQKYGIRAGVFVLGDPKNAKNTIGEKYLNKTELSTLKRSGWNIGWHTEHHYNLLNNNSDLVTEDFKRGREVLDSISNQNNNYVAYPYGMYNDEVENCARGAGFNKAFTVDGFVAKSSNYSIDRVTVTSDMSAEDVTKLIRPVGLLVNKSFTFLWNIKDKN